MRKPLILLLAGVLIGLLLEGGSAQGQKTRALDNTLELRPVIVQGAMDLEVKKFNEVSKLNEVFRTRLTMKALSV
jgi:hypothetical protein